MTTAFDPVMVLNFSTWKEFKTDLFDRIGTAQATGMLPANSRPRLLFRGQACANWPLWTSFDRLMEDNSVPLSKIEHIYDRSMQDFYIHGMEMGAFSAIGRLGQFNSFPALRAEPNLLAELEAFAQHYGFPTRLLDWSESPYVAAFFAACEPEKCSSKAIAVWCLDVIEARHLTNDNDLIVRDRALDGEKRQVWQRASFTINRTNLTRTDEIFLPVKGKLRGDPRVPVLFKCTIPVSESIEMLRDLDFMRINYLTVYPDIEGLVKYAKYKARVLIVGP